MLVQNNISHETIDHRYLDITIEGSVDPSSVKEALFSSTRAVPYLKKCNEWELGIVRFQIPSTFIPSFFYNPEWEVTLFYGLNKATAPIIYDLGSYNVNLGPYANLKPIYNVTDFILMVNTAYKVAAGVLTGLVGSLIDPPQFLFDAGSGIITLLAPKLLFDTTLNIGYIGMNSSLYEYFRSISALYYKDTNPLYNGNFIFRVYETLTNTETINSIVYYKMIGETSTIDNWEVLTQIVISCNSVPVTPEMRAVGSGATPLVKAILTDFNFVGLLNNNLDIQFYNQGNIRWYDMVSAHELTTFDLEFNWKDVKGNIYPIYIGANQSANIKICFRKKGRFDPYEDKGSY